MDKMKARVFVTQENPNLNYLPAEEFGDIVFLTREDFSPVRNSLHNGALMTDVRTKLKDFDPERDYITVSGSPVVAAVVFMILSERTRLVNILRWSNRDHLYQHLVINTKPI